MQVFLMSESVYVCVARLTQTDCDSVREQLSDAQIV